MRLNPDYVFQRFEDFSVLVPVGKPDQYFNGILRLNGTATYIVESLREETTREALVQLLIDRYEGEEAQFVESVDRVLETLRRVGALKETELQRIRN